MGPYQRPHVSTNLGSSGYNLWPTKLHSHLPYSCLGTCLNISTHIYGVHIPEITIQEYEIDVFI